MNENGYFEATRNFYSRDDKTVEVKAAIESYNSFVLMLTMKWADTYNYSDKDLHEYMTGAMYSILDRADRKSVV